MTSATYNGWANYETWYVALWIQNDEGLYNLAKSCCGYLDFVDLMINDFKAKATPDGVAYNDPKLSLSELAVMMQEL